MKKVEPKKLDCGCRPTDPWPPPAVEEAPRPSAPSEPPDHGLSTPPYALRGPQIEPEAAFWTICRLPCLVRIEDLAKRTDDPDNECFFPPYPTQASVVKDEIDELIELASLRDDPDAITSTASRRERRGISPLLQLRPQPISAVVNIHRDPMVSAVIAGRHPEPHAIDIVRGMEVDAAYPVVATGRELARYFESETPGLAHRMALNYLIAQQNWSPPRQALVWAAFDTAVASALMAAWYYKWAAGIGLPGVAPRNGVSYRPRPIEMDYRVSVLYNRQVSDTGSGDNGRRLLPDPSPGTPRHPAYPSGHATYGGAASDILSYFFPDFTEEFDRLADNCGMARLWAGIHWRSDHVEGVKLGRCVARMVIEQLEASCICPADPCAPPDNCAPPPGPEQLKECREAVVRCCEGRPPEDDRPRPGRESAAALSDQDLKAQAAGPQEGAAPSPGSGQWGPQTGPQEGGASEGASQRPREQAEGPQEGGH